MQKVLVYPNENKKKYKNNPALKNKWVLYIYL
jgi:hypothetical protein